MSAPGHHPRCWWDTRGSMCSCSDEEERDSAVAAAREAALEEAAQVADIAGREPSEATVPGAARSITTVRIVEAIRALKRGGK